MEELKKWQIVNTAETAEQLLNAMRDLSDDGIIKGTNGSPLSAEEQATLLKAYMRDTVTRNNLTRNYGIRKQAFYLKYKVEHN